MALERYLNQLFAAPRAPRKAPGTHVVNGIRITKTGKLWSCKLPGGDTLFSTHLGDLKETVRRNTAE